MNQKDYDELSDYAMYEGCELGDYATSLLVMRDYNTDHGMSEDFSNNLDCELIRILSAFKKHAKIITKTETIEREFKELEWTDE